MCFIAKTNMWEGMRSGTSTFGKAICEALGCMCVSLLTATVGRNEK